MVSGAVTLHFHTAQSMLTGDDLLAENIYLQRAKKDDKPC